MRGDFCQTFREDFAPTLLKLSPKLAEQGALPNPSHEVSTTDTKARLRHDKKENDTPVLLTDRDAEILNKISAN